MATFEVQVEGLTGIAIDGSSSPTQNELTEYLKDGVIDVTNRCISLKPNDITNFQRTTTSDSQGVGVGGAKLISVMREAGADGSSDGSTAWRDCRQVAPSLQSRVVDIDSLHYASVYNPVYIRDDNNTINVYPTPSANNGIKVFYVNEEPRDVTNNASLTYAHANIKYFPNDKVYLVVIYASMKSLENALSAKGIPTVSGDGTELTSVDDLDTDNTIDVHADQIEIDQWWSTAGHLIEGAEDLEMASVQLQKINAYIQAYGAQLQGNSTDYQWMQARHQILSKQYDTAFAMMRPPQPQVAGAR